MELNYINLDYLKSIAGENKELILEMLGIFREQAPEFISGMNEAYSKKDWPTLSAIAHKAKSSVAVMGLDDLAAEMKTLELNAKNEEMTETYKDTIENFEDVCQKALEEVSKIEKNYQ